MSNAIAIIPQHEQRALSLKEMSEISDVFVKSGFFSDLKSQAQAVVKMMAGQELGLEPFSAMAELHVIQGKITMSAGLLAKKVKQSGKYDYRVTEQSDKACSIQFYQNNEPIGVSSFTIEEARKAQVKNLDKFPRNMLFARAMSNGVRWYCPDVTGSVGVYTDGEIEEPLASVTPMRRVESQSEAIEAEVVVESIDDSYIQAIKSIAAEIGADLSKALKFLEAKSVESLTQAQGERLLKQLEQRKAAIEYEQQAKVDDALPEDLPPVSGLDQWKCTQESGSRALAKNVLSVWSEALEHIPGLTDELLRSEMDTETGVTSRKDLTAEKANQFIQFLRGWIDDVKKKGSSQ